MNERFPSPDLYLKLKASGLNITRLYMQRGYYWNYYSAECASEADVDALKAIGGFIIDTHAPKHSRIDGSLKRYTIYFRRRNYPGWKTLWQTAVLILAAGDKLPALLKKVS